jgi:hypothetical protein
MYSLRLETACPTPAQEHRFQWLINLQVNNDNSVPAKQSVYFPILDTTVGGMQNRSIDISLRTGMRPAYLGRQCEIQNVVNGVDERACGSIERCIIPTYLAMIY